jgi:hypothetical protein
MSMVKTGTANGSSCEESASFRVAVNRMDHGRAVRVLVLAVMSALATLMGVATLPAHAAAIHEYVGSIATEVPAEGPHGEAVPHPGPVGGVGAITIDQGKLWVADNGYRADEFDATTGEFLSQLDIPVERAHIENGIAVGHATGETELYLGADLGEETPEALVDVFGSAGTEQNYWLGRDTPAKSLGCFDCGSKAQVAVDDSNSDWASGDVYVSAGLVGVVDVFKPEAGGNEKYVTQIAGPSPSEHFVQPEAVAVNEQTGEVVVLDTSGIYVFKPTVLGEYEFVRKITATPAGPLQIGYGAKLAVGGGEEDGDIYVVTNGNVDQFSAAGTYLGLMHGSTPGQPISNASSVYVDPETHDVYVGVADGVEVYAADSIRPDVTTTAPIEVKAKSAVLSGTVNPDGGGEATCRVIYGEGASLDQSAPCSSPVANGTSPVAVQAAIANLAPHTTYSYRVEASNANGLNVGLSTQTLTFATAGPALDSSSSSNVTSTSAVIDSKIDPNGGSTTYYIQYGTSASYGTDLPAAPGASVGSGHGDVALNLNLQGLAPSTTYHYRAVVVGEDNAEPVIIDGPDHTFTTQAIGSTFTMVDGRQWELVTPPDKHGAGLYVPGYEQGVQIQAAENGSALTYGATAPMVTNPAGAVPPEVTQELSRRRTPGEWETTELTPPHDSGTWNEAVGHSAEYKLFSSDLSLGFVEPVGSTPMPPLPSNAEHTIYLRHNGECASSSPETVPDTCYQALVTAENTAPGVKFSGIPRLSSAVALITATPDLSHVILGSEVALTDDPGNTGGGDYMWSAGKLTWLDGQALGSNARNSISVDGSRVLGTNFAGHEGLDLHDMSTGETVQLDAGHAFEAYWTASTDDSRVFYSHNGELYVYELTSSPGQPLAGKAADLTVDPNPHQSAELVGVPGASADGSVVYLVARGSLTSAPNDRGETAVVGEPNLYVEHYEASTGKWAIAFVTTLSAEDSPDWDGSSSGQLTYLTSSVSPSGRYFSFMSEQNLTGYDNHDANSGAPDKEVFLYDASSGHLACPSCNPTGARPTGLLKGPGYQEHLVDVIAYLWDGQWLSGSIPGWDRNSLIAAMTQPHYLSDDGRLFFNSDDALVPADVNGTEDVYEYEPAGQGSCVPPSYDQSASDVYDAAMGGCVALISSGSAPEESIFLEATPGGEDVFFTTSARLSAQDTDTSPDIYDAHLCNSAAPCAPPAAAAAPPCETGDACKAAPSPQPAIFGEPASATFSGSGNVTAPASTVQRSKPLTRAQKLARALKQCRGKPKGKRAACERKARKQYQAKQAVKRARARKSLSARTGR